MKIGAGRCAHTIGPIDCPKCRAPINIHVKGVFYLRFFGRTLVLHITRDRPAGAGATGLSNPPNLIIPADPGQIRPRGRIL